MQKRGSEVVQKDQTIMYADVLDGRPPILIPDCDCREGRFLLRRIDEMSRMPEPTKEDSSFKRKLSKREKKQLKKQGCQRAIQCISSNTKIFLV